MQVQDNQTKAGAPSDPFGLARETQRGFSRANSTGHLNLFADIFNSFAVSVPPPSPPSDPAEIEPQNDTSPATVSESKSSKDDEDTSDDDVSACGLACYALPVEKQPIVAENDEVADAKTISAESSIAPTGDEASGQSELAANSVPVNKKLTSQSDASTDLGANVPVAAAAPTETVEALATVQENVDTKTKAKSEASDSKLSKEASETVVADSFVEPQATAQPSVLAKSSSDGANGQTLVSENTQAGAVTNESAQTSDRGDRRRRNSDSDHSASVVDRQDAGNANSVDATRPQASSTIDVQTPSPNVTSVDNASAARDINASQNTQTVLASVASLASLPAQLASSQRAGSGALTQSVQSVTGAPTTGGVNQSRDRSTESAGAGSTASGRRTDVADRARLVHRIAKAFQKMGIDSGQVRLKMHPDELGGVQIEMQVNGRSVKAKVVADSEDARKLLQDSLPELRQRLESQGLTVERLDVELRSDNESSSLLNQNHQQQSSNSNDDASRRDGVWRRPVEARNAVNSTAGSKSEPRQALRTVSSERSLDLKI